MNQTMTSEQQTKTPMRKFRPNTEVAVLQKGQVLTSVDGLKQYVVPSNVERMVRKLENGAKGVQISGVIYALAEQPVFVEASGDVEVATATVPMEEIEEEASKDFEVIESSPAPQQQGEQQEEEKVVSASSSSEASDDLQLVHCDECNMKVFSDALAKHKARHGTICDECKVEVAKGMMNKHKAGHKLVKNRFARRTERMQVKAKAAGLLADSPKLTMTTATNSTKVLMMRAEDGTMRPYESALHRGIVKVNPPEIAQVWSGYAAATTAPAMEMPAQ